MGGGGVQHWVPTGFPPQQACRAGSCRCAWHGVLLKQPHPGPQAAVPEAPARPTGYSQLKVVALRPAPHAGVAGEQQRLCFRSALRRYPPHAACEGRSRRCSSELTSLFCIPLTARPGRPWAMGNVGGDCGCS